MRHSVIIEDLQEREIRPPGLFHEYLEIARSEALDEFADDAGLVHVRCPGCDADEPVLAFRKHGFSYQACRSCETLYASPRPDVARLADFRRRSRALRFWSERFLAATADARRQSIHARRADWLAGVLDEYLPDAGSCLDVGAGLGVFLEELRDSGRLTVLTGIETRPELAEACRARGLDVIESSLEESAAELEVDVVTGFESLQQAASPLHFVQAAYEALRPGGLLLLTTLTGSGFDVRVLGEHSRNVYPPFHINFLSVEGIERLLARVGLEPLEVSTPGQLDVGIVEQAVADGVEVDPFLSYLLRRRDARAKASLQEFLQRNRLSSHARVAARRPQDGRYHHPA